MIQATRRFPKVVVIILNWNNRELLSKCLSSFGLIDYPNYEIVVVDNASNDGSTSMMSRDHPNIRLLVNRSNLGWSGGNNVGIVYAMKHLSPDYILLLNNDTLMVQPEFLSALVRAGQKTRGPGIIGNKVLAEDGSLQHSGWYFARDFREILASKGLTRDLGDASDDTFVDGVSGACFMVERRVIESIGLLDQDFVPYSFEELEYFSRARSAGVDVLYTPEVRMLHYGKQSIRKVSDVKAIQYVVTNMMRFAFIHLPLRTYLLFQITTSKSALFGHERFSRSKFLPILVLANLSVLINLGKFVSKRPLHRYIARQASSHARPSQSHP